MQVLADKLANFVVRSGVVPEQAYVVFQYGFQIGIEMGFCFVVSFCIALFLHMLPEFLVFITIFILLRTYAGGLHMESFVACFLCSVIVQTAALVLSSLYHLPLMGAWVIIVSCSSLILWLSPVDNVNRELEEIEKAHFKKVTLKIVIGIWLFSGGCTIFQAEEWVSLVALTILIVLCSQFIGIIKYKIEKRNNRRK